MRPDKGVTHRFTSFTWTLGRIRMAVGSRRQLDHGIALRRPHRLSREQHRISKTVSRIGAFAPVLGIVLLVFELWACAH